MPEEIVFDRVEFHYDARGRDAESVIREFSLRIEPGECHLILGPSGCGKSTVLKLIAGFEHPTAGEVRVRGQVVSAPGSDRVMIFQGDDSLFPWLTTLNNVEFGLRVAGMPHAHRRTRALEYLDLVGLRGQEGKFPAELSGGMKQRVQLARALVTEPTTLLMDEPFGALDAQTRSVLQQELARIWRQTACTIVFITHDIAEAILLADRITVMTAGPAATIREVVAIDLPRPRALDEPQFGTLYARLARLLVGETVARA